MLPVPPLEEQVRIRKMVDKLTDGGRAVADEVAGVKLRTATLHQAVLEGTFCGVLAGSE